MRGGGGYTQANDVQLLPFHLTINLFRTWCAHSLLYFGPQKTLTHTTSIPEKASSSHPAGWLVSGSVDKVCA